MGGLSLWQQQDYLGGIVLTTALAKQWHTPWLVADMLSSKLE